MLISGSRASIWRAAKVVSSKVFWGCMLSTRASCGGEKKYWCQGNPITICTYWAMSELGCSTSLAKLKVSYGMILKWEAVKKHVHRRAVTVTCVLTIKARNDAKLWPKTEPLRISLYAMLISSSKASIWRITTPLSSEVFWGHMHSTRAACDGEKK